MRLEDWVTPALASAQKQSRNCWSRRYRIGPAEVENALAEHPAVAESAVVSSPDPIRGQVRRRTGGQGICEWALEGWCREIFQSSGYACCTYAMWTAGGTVASVTILTKYRCAGSFNPHNNLMS